LLCSEVWKEAEETFDDLRKLFESFQSKVPSYHLESQTQESSKLAPNDNPWHVELNKSEPYFFGENNAYFTAMHT
jgi:hypothetical protein